MAIGTSYRCWKIEGTSRLERQMTLNVSHPILSTGKVFGEFWSLLLNGPEFDELLRGKKPF
jgi:hypothetical protein